MKLKITTDYAIRTVLYLAETGRVTTSIEVSEAMNIPHNYLINIIRDMRKGDLITTLPGAKGGCMLAKPSKEIRLYDVVMAMERTIQINRCLEKDGYCSRGASSYCQVHRVYAEIQSEVEDRLKRCTIADILNASPNKIGQWRENQDSDAPVGPAEENGEAIAGQSYKDREHFFLKET